MAAPWFPDPRLAGPEGLVAVGGDLSPGRLLAAYRAGIFPWPHPGLPLAWFSPDPRGVLEFDRLHVPRSLAAARRKTRFAFSIDRAFPAVIAACRSVPRPGQRGAWLTPAMERAYLELHRLGLARSAEAWAGERLVGGIYGVAYDGCFSGESMFHLETGASKLALLSLVDALRSRGLAWMDIQMLTPHMELLGARAIPRSDFLDLLARTRALSLPPRSNK
ncbi:MAG: leucyl/phenylalanyl-tRNA--protein transferase [Elusimicrobia bacterium]|nr:leucyl/phenylalanyl-tRNA--protein transferase [Elusimicrobiota bacterium]